MKIRNSIVTKHPTTLRVWSEAWKWWDMMNRLFRTSKMQT